MAWLERVGNPHGVSLIDLADAKRQLRVHADEDEFDTEIQDVIDAAQAAIDIDEDGFGGLGFPLVTETWKRVGAGFTSDVLNLKLGRVQDIVDVTYYDADNVLQTLAPSTYSLRRCGRDYSVGLASGGTWPGIAAREDAVAVQFTAGYGDAATVPSDIKQALRQLIVHFHDNREAVAVGTIASEMPLAYRSLLKRYRRFV